LIINKQNSELCFGLCQQ